MVFFEFVVVRGDLVQNSSHLLGLILLFFGFFYVSTSLFFQLLFSGKILLLPFCLLGSEVAIIVVVVASSTTSALISTRVVVIVVLSVSTLFLVASNLAVLQGSLSGFFSLEDFNQDIRCARIILGHAWLNAIEDLLEEIIFELRLLFFRDLSKQLFERGCFFFPAKHFFKSEF